MAAERKWTDQDIEIAIGRLLQAGVLLSAFVVLVGACVYLARRGHTAVDYRVFRGEPAELRRLGGILRQAATLQGRAIIQFGLILLIATPVARVAFSVWGFARERDSMYVSFTLLVLAILCYSLFGSAYP